MKLISEFNDQNVASVIVEANENGKKDYFIQGVFMQSEIKNRNGRVYPKEIMAKENELLSLGGQAAAAAHSLGTPLSTILLTAKELKKEFFCTLNASYIVIVFNKYSFYSRKLK